MISSEGGEARPLDRVLKCDLGEKLEILIRNMPDDPYGLVWSQLQAMVAGLWEYIVTGMRHRTVTFDILDIEDEAQIGWSDIVKREGGSFPKRIAKRGLQLSSPALLSHENSVSGAIPWKVEDSDMTLKFTPLNEPRGVREKLDLEVVKNLFIEVVEIIQNGIAAHREDELYKDDAFRYGNLIMLEIINWRDLMTWGQLATAIIGLVEFIVDNNHLRPWYFSIYVQGDPMVEVGIGKIRNGLIQYNNVTVHENVTVARRSLVDGDEAG